MVKGNMIQYLPHDAIDKQRWDTCVEQASNGLIYGSSIYLDHMTDNWDGIVLNDYEAVMPLPWRKKYRIYYLYQPFLTAQLGLFGNNIDAHLLSAFFDAIPKKFRYWDMMLNHGNLYSTARYPLYARMNYVLNLQQPYEVLFTNFRENIRRNIRKAEQYGCSAKKAVDVRAIEALAKEQLADVDDADLSRFVTLYEDLKAEGKAETYGILSKQGELLASCVFLFSNGRAYYILVGNHPNGRTLGASHTLINEFIKERAGQNLMLDFEGSDIRNLGFFYSSFGATEERYAAIKLNKLPPYLRWLKK